MLQFIRERAKGWLAWVIVILITIPFALWGIQQYFGGGGEVTVAEVNGIPIQQQQLERAYYQHRQRLQQVMGENFRPELFPEQRLKRQVLQQMVEREYMAQTVMDRGFRLGDRQLAAEIRNIPAFSEDGRFSRETYERFLRSQGFSPAAFEARLRRDLLAGQFQRGIAGSAFATDSEVDAFVRLQNQRRDIGAITLPLERYRSRVEVTEDELRNQYESNQANFMAPEQVKIAYVELSLERIAEGIEVGEEQLRARYEGRRDNFRSPEERHARHILIEVEAGAGEEAAAQARARAAEVREMLDSGRSFAELAKEYSDDPGSAEEGGDLGFFGRGVMDESFENAVFSMKPGEVDGPVRTTFGYHIIKLEAVRGGDVKPFEEVKDQLRRDYKRAQAESLYYDMAERLANLTFEQPDTLAPTAEALGLKVKESDWFSRKGGDEGIVSEPKLVQAVFSADVLEAGNNSEPVEIATNHLVVARVKDRRPQRQLPLDEVEADIRQRLRENKAREAAKEAAREIAERIAEGRPPVELAKESGLEWKLYEGVTRNAAEGPSPAILRAGFGLRRPEGDGPSTRVVSLRGGDQAVVVVLAVHAAGPDAVEESAVTQKQEALEQAAGEAEFAGVVQGVRSRSEIRVMDKNL